MKAYFKALVMTVVVVVAHALYYRYWAPPMLNTDPVVTGLTIRTDNLTGCQYLHRDGLTPRIAADGKTHLGCKESP